MGATRKYDPSECIFALKLANVFLCGTKKQRRPELTREEATALAYSVPECFFQPGCAFSGLSVRQKLHLR